MTLPHPMFKRSVYVTRLDFFLEETVKKKELYKQANYKACSPPVWNNSSPLKCKPEKTNCNPGRRTETKEKRNTPYTPTQRSTVEGVIVILNNIMSSLHKVATCIGFSNFCWKHLLFLSFHMFHQKYMKVPSIFLLSFVGNLRLHFLQKLCRDYCLCGLLPPVWTIAW